MENINVVIKSIVTHQQMVMGPLAIEQANTVEGLRVEGGGKVVVSSNAKSSPSDILLNLVKKYEKLFGQASVEVCKDAIKESGVQIDDNNLPKILR